MSQRTYKLKHFKSQHTQLVLLQKKTYYKMYTTVREGVVRISHPVEDLSIVPPGTVKVICRGQHLRSLRGLPDTVKVVFCDRNRLTSFEGLSNSVTSLTCSQNEITSFEGLSNS